HIRGPHGRHPHRPRFATLFASIDLDRIAVVARSRRFGRKPEGSSLRPPPNGRSTLMFSGSWKMRMYINTRECGFTTRPSGGPNDLHAQFFRTVLDHRKRHTRSDASGGVCW